MMSSVCAVAPRHPSSAPARASSWYRHNPYAYTLLQEKDRLLSVESFASTYHAFAEDEIPAAEVKPQPSHMKSETTFTNKSGSIYSSASNSPLQRQLETSGTKNGAAIDSFNDGGVSETCSDSGSIPPREASLLPFSVTGSQARAANLPASMATGSVSATATASMAAASTVIRYASVNFRFGSAWFVAPFRTFVGDMVVVQYPSNNSLHMGLVSAVTTAKPITFYTEDNMDPNYLSPEELQTVPRLLRHARDFDKETKLDLRNHDLNALANARSLAVELGVPVQFLDAEWLLDLSAVTFLVKVYGNTNLVDKLVDELALQEGAEVVFTYPVSSSTMYP